MSEDYSRLAELDKEIAELKEENKELMRMREVLISKIDTLKNNIK